MLPTRAIRLLRLLLTRSPTSTLQYFLRGKLCSPKCREGRVLGKGALLYYVSADRNFMAQSSLLLWAEDFSVRWVHPFDDERRLQRQGTLLIMRSQL